MNIFAVDDNPIIAAESLHDSHVIKMATESAQILSTVVDPIKEAYSQDSPRKRYLVTTGKRIYMPTHTKHPCVIWAGIRPNWQWLYLHAMALCEEYQHRFGRVHGTLEVVVALASELPVLDTITTRTPFVLAMPEIYRGPDPIEAYRQYYIGEKMTPGGRIAKWTNREPPQWIKESGRFFATSEAL